MKMKISELKSIIRECVREYLTENTDEVRKGTVELEGTNYNYEVVVKVDINSIEPAPLDAADREAISDMIVAQILGDGKK